MQPAFSPAMGHTLQFPGLIMISPERIAFAIVVFLHIACIALLLWKPLMLSEKPVLSFTVTLQDISSASHKVSEAESSASAPAMQVVNEVEVQKEGQAITDAAQKKNTKSTETNVSSRKPAPASLEKQTAVLGGTESARFDAAYLKNSPPSYPALSRRLGEQGTVLLQVYVNTTGKAEQVAVYKSSGYSRLDNAALKTVKTWQFIPARRGNAITASWVQVPVDFILE